MQSKPVSHLLLWHIISQQCVHDRGITIIESLSLATLVLIQPLHLQITHNKLRTSRSIFYKKNWKFVSSAPDQDFLLTLETLSVLSRLQPPKKYQIWLQRRQISTTYLIQFQHRLSKTGAISVSSFQQITRWWLHTSLAKSCHSKTAVEKKRVLDKEDRKNFRLVSNLTFISKIRERIGVGSSQTSWSQWCTSRNSVLIGSFTTQRVLYLKCTLISTWLWRNYMSRSWDCLI